MADEEEDLQQLHSETREAFQPGVGPVQPVHNTILHGPARPEDQQGLADQNNRDVQPTEFRDLRSVSVDSNGTSLESLVATDMRRPDERETVEELFSEGGPRRRFQCSGVTAMGPLGSATPAEQSSNSRLAAAHSALSLALPPRISCSALIAEARAMAAADATNDSLEADREADDRPDMDAADDGRIDDLGDDQSLQLPAPPGQARAERFWNEVQHPLTRVSTLMSRELDSDQVAYVEAVLREVARNRNIHELDESVAVFFLRRNVPLVTAVATVVHIDQTAAVDVIGGVVEYEAYTASPNPYLPFDSERVCSNLGNQAEASGPMEQRMPPRPNELPARPSLPLDSERVWSNLGHQAEASGTAPAEQRLPPRPNEFPARPKHDEEYDFEETGSEIDRQSMVSQMSMLQSEDSLVIQNALLKDLQDPLALCSFDKPEILAFAQDVFRISLDLDVGKSDSRRTAVRAVQLVAQSQMTHAGTVSFKAAMSYCTHYYRSGMALATAWARAVARSDNQRTQCPEGTCAIGAGAQSAAAMNPPAARPARRKLTQPVTVSKPVVFNMDAQQAMYSRPAARGYGVNDTPGGGANPLLFAAGIRPGMVAAAGNQGNLGELADQQRLQFDAANAAPTQYQFDSDVFQHAAHHSSHSEQRCPEMRAHAQRQAGNQGSAPFHSQRHDADQFEARATPSGAAAARAESVGEHGVRSSFSAAVAGAVPSGSTPAGVGAATPLHGGVSTARHPGGIDSRVLDFVQDHYDLTGSMPAAGSMPPGWFVATPPMPAGLESGAPSALPSGGAGKGVSFGGGGIFGGPSPCGPSVGPTGGGSPPSGSAPSGGGGGGTPPPDLSGGGSTPSGPSAPPITPVAGSGAPGGSGEIQYSFLRVQ